MHPNPAFNGGTADALLTRAADLGFAHIFVGTAAGPMVVHAPVTRHDNVLRFHVARANRIAAHLDGAQVLVSVAGAQGYVTPNWYAAPRNQVPTWNYVAVEIEGRATALSDAALRDQLDSLAAAHEPRVIPNDPWTSAKTDPGILAKMMTAIRGFEIVPDAIRGTTKLSQNKGATDRARVITGLRGAGNAVLADAMTAEA